ncbi:hypothetical protein Droror1_Dr00021047 [Drosera rotundifolia]
MFDISGGLYEHNTNFNSPTAAETQAEAVNGGGGGGGDGCVRGREMEIRSTRETEEEERSWVTEIWEMKQLGDGVARGKSAAQIWGKESAGERISAEPSQPLLSG